MQYEVTGSGFNSMPAQIVGIAASDNNNPLRHRYENFPAFLLYPIERSDTRLVLEARNTEQYNSRYYLGGIVSEDRETLYFVNNSNPLP